MVGPETTAMNGVPRIPAGTGHAKDTRHLLMLLAVDLLIVSGMLWFVLVVHPFVPMDRLGDYPVWGWLRWWLVLWALWIPLASALGLYDLALAGDPNRVIVFTVVTWAITSLLYGLVPVISAPLFVRRWIWFLFFAGTAVVLALWRGAHALLWTSRPPWRLLFVGASQAVREAAAALGGIQGVDVVGVFDYGSDDATTDSQPVGALLDRCAALIAQHAVDGIVVDNALSYRPSVQRLIAHSAEAGIPVSSLSACSETWLGKAMLDHSLVTDWMGDLEGKKVALALHRTARRAADLLCATLGLPALAIAVPAVALANRLHGEPRVLEHALCLGRGGRRFRAITFRRPGGHRLVNLPMLWNLLAGDITLIGPRMLSEAEILAHPEHRSTFLLRSAVLPGLTGWAQVRCALIEGEDRTEAELPYDLYYVLHRSLTLDLAIVYHRLQQVFR